MKWGSRRRRLAASAAVLRGVALLSLATASCGGGGCGPGPTPPTPTSFTLTVQATGAGVSTAHTLGALTVTVN